MLLEHLALTLQAVGRGGTTVGQLSQILQLMLVLLLVDIHIYIGALGNLQRIVHLEAVAACYGKTCYELIYVGRAVG